MQEAVVMVEDEHLTKIRLNAHAYLKSDTLSVEMAIKSFKVTGISNKRDESKDYLNYEDDSVTADFKNRSRDDE